MHVHRSARLALVLVACLSSLAHAEGPPIAARDPIYLMVIDHSGSMRDEGRWRKAKALALDLLRAVPDGAHVWVGRFGSACISTSFDLRQRTDRERAIAHVEREYTEPASTSPTALFDAIGAAVVNAEALLKDVPGRPVNLMIYSDGADNVSKHWCAGADPNEVRCGPKLSVCHRVHRLAQPPNDATVFIGRYAGAPEVLSSACARRVEMPETAVHYVPVEVTPKQAVIARDAPAFDLTFSLAGEATALLGPETSHRRVQVVFNGSGPLAGARLAATEVVLQGKTTQQRMELVLPAGLPDNQDLRGTIRLTWPAPKSGIVLATNAVDVTVQKQELDITDVWPCPGREQCAVPIGRPVQFLVRTASAAMVTWSSSPESDANKRDFDARGAELTHTYTEAGPRRVTVTVSRGDQKRRRQLKLNVLDVSFRIERPDVVFAGQPAVLRVDSRTSQGFTQFRWLVDGLPFEGRGAAGSEFETTFDQTGRVTVRAQGTHAQLEGVQQSVELDVLARPELMLEVGGTGHVNRESYGYGELPLEATTVGPVKRVRFIVARVSDPTLRREVGPVDVGESHRAVAAVQLYERDRWERVVITAEGEVTGWKGAISSRSHTIALTSPDRTLAFTSPAANAAMRFATRTPIVANVSAPGVTEVVWSAHVGTEVVARDVVAPVIEGKSTFELEIPIRPTDVDVVVSCVGRFGPTFPAPPTPPTATATWSVQHAPLDLELSVATAGGWRRPYLLVATCTPECTRATWDFGDATPELTGPALSVQHEYVKAGSYSVRVTGTAAGGRTAQASTTTVVSFAPIRPNIDIPAAIDVGNPVRLLDRSEGDVASAAWLLDDVAVHDGQHEVVIDASGHHVITRLLVAPDGTEHVLRAAIFVRNPNAFYLVLFACIVSVLATLIVFAGNRPARYELRAAGRDSPLANGAVTEIPWRRLQWRRARPHKVARMAVSGLAPEVPEFDVWRSEEYQSAAIVVAQSTESGKGHKGNITLDDSADSGLGLQLKHHVSDLSQWILTGQRGGDANHAPPELHLLLDDARAEKPIWSDVFICGIAVVGAIAVVYGAWQYFCLA